MVVEYQNVTLENIHISNIVQTEKVVHMHLHMNILCVCVCVCVFEVRDMLTVKVYGGDIGCFLFWIVCVHEFHTDPYKFSD